MTTDLYSVLPGIQPSAQDILQSELLCTQILSAAFPTLDTRIGTALRDLTIRPSALLLSLLKASSDYLFSQDKLINVTDSTPISVVDSILSNWFLDRQLGTKSVISARLFFARQKNTYIGSETFFSPDNVYKFYPLTSSSYASNSMALDSYSNEYYIDIELIAEQEGSAYDIGVGSLLYFTNFDPYFLRAEINFLKTSSIPLETNTQFISRAKNSISTRNLINIPSIDSNLRIAFNYINRLVSIGYGDEEMIRDKILAVFDAQSPRILSNLSSSGSIATATLAEHNYTDGQKVLISGATPSAYNGEFLITVVNSSIFTYDLGTSSSAVTVLPTVNAINNPVLLHNGGKVDIYCSDSLATSIVQLTLDEFGKSYLTGPIFNFSRSEISGGTEEDTVPLDNEVLITEISITGTTATATTSGSHPYTLTDLVTVEGATQLKSVSGIVCSGTTVTVTSTGHEFLVGNTVVISGVLPSTYNGSFIITTKNDDTFTYEVLSNISTTGSGTMFAEVNLVNGEWVLTGVTSNTFSYTIEQTSTAVVAGTITGASSVKYTSVDTYKQSKVIDNITCTGTVATVTLANHGYTLSRYVTISGATPSGYNGTWLITDIVNSNQFTFNVPSNVAGSFSIGTASFVTPRYDYGFSQSQSQIVDLGVVWAGKTVSFEIDYFQNLDSVQSYLDLAANRVVCADYLARGFNFYYLDVTLTSYNTTVPDSALASQVITSYLKNLAAGDNFIISDMVTKLRLNGIINIKTPPLVTYTKYTRDLDSIETGTITDILDPNDRTNVFLLNTVTTAATNIGSGTLLIL